MKQPDVEELPEFSDMMRRFLDKLPLEERLAGLGPEERLAGLAPEERLAGLSTEQVVLALPLDVLRALPDAYIGSLPVEAQERIRKRVQGAAH